MTRAKLSPYHKIFYNEWKINSNASCYNLVFDQVLSKNLDLPRLQSALYRFISEHFIFNSHVTNLHDELYWIQNSHINKLEQFPIGYTNQEILDYVALPFDLEAGPLYRFAIFCEMDGNYRFILVLHNILIDRKFFAPLIDNISQYYNDPKYQLLHRPSDLAVTSFIYSNDHTLQIAPDAYLTEQTLQINSITEELLSKVEANSVENKQFWTNALSEIEPLDLRFIRNNSASVIPDLAGIHNQISSKQPRFKELHFNFANDIVVKLKMVEKKHSLSTYWYSQIIFAILLYKYTSQDKFAISYLTSIKESQNLLYGSGINTNMAPYQINIDTTILDIITQITQFTNIVNNESSKHAYYPIDEIVACTNKGNLDVFFIENDFRETKFAFNAVDTIGVNHEFEVDVLAKLVFEEEIKDDVINFRVRYNADAIDEAILANFVRHYQKLFTDILQDLNQGRIDRSIAEYSVLDAREYNEIVYEWNQTDKEYPEHKTIHQLFEEQVVKTPNNIAVVYEENKLTYQELNEKSNQLAHYLRTEFQIVGDDLIALFLDRSEYILIAILAVLKSGAAYVPIDPGHPDARIKYMLEDTKAKVVLANKIYKTRLKNIAATTATLPMNTVIDYVVDDTATPIIPADAGVNAGIDHNSDLNVAISQKMREHYDTACKSYIVDIDTTKSWDKFKLYSSANLELNITSKNLAYVIYTSGTTGTPKGVMVEHKGVINYLSNVKEKIFDQSIMNVDYSTNIAFDLSVTTILGSLCNGSRVCVYAGNVQDLAKYKEHLLRNQVDIIKVVPSYFQLLQNELENTNIYKVILGGEKIYLFNIAKTRKKLLKIYDEYGPTETVVGSCLSCIYDDGRLYEQIGIGKLYNNHKSYVLDSYLNPVPIGSIGELYVGGDGVARGYLNQPKLTAKVFIANPFQSEIDKQRRKNGTLYKTGDLVRYLDSGNVEYIGRNDFQVKIRGYRIEFGEIESVLSGYPEIRQTVVMPCQNTDEGERRIDSETNKYLVGYYVADSVVIKEKLFKYLSERLPEYMVPSALVQLDELPLTLNGKLDRKSLPAPEFTLTDTYIAPRNELELELGQRYAEILGLPLDKISIDSDFFKLGGNSILAIKLVNMLNIQFNCAVKVSSLFSANTIEKIANLIKSTANEFEFKEYLINSIDTTNLYQPFNLNNMQQAYYFGRLPSFELGNISTHYYSEVKFAALDYLKLEIAVNKLIQRHLGLRTVFINGQQQYLEVVPEYKVRYYESTDEEILLSIRDELSHKIYIVDQFPLFDFVVTKYNDHYILHTSFDVLLMDAYSCQILFKELGVLYDNPNTRLPRLNISYRSYVTKLTQAKQGELFTQAKKYWVNKVDDYNFEMNLPLQCRPTEVNEPRFNRISKVIAKDVWQKIENKARLHGIGVTSLILTIYAKVLSYWTNQTNLCINLTLFNRLPLHKDINEVIGDFTVLELFNYQNKIKDNILGELQNIHQQLWEDIEHNLFDGIDFQRLIRKERGLPNNQVLCPVVLTSILGDKIGYGESLINDSYLGMGYSITQTSQVWLDNKAYETKDGFVAEWDYVEQLFEPSTIKAMHKHYCDLIEYMADADWNNDKFPKLELPNADLKLIEQANSATQPIVTETLFSYYENYVTTNQLLANIAVIEYTDAVHQYSYSEILNNSGLLAKYLYSLIHNRYCENTRVWNAEHSQQSKLIAVLSENGYNQVLATLAIMKSGCAYLPLNIYWPVGRLDEVLVQGQVNIVLISRLEASKAEIKEKLANKYKFLIIEDVLEEIHNKTTLQTISLPVVSPDDVAYVIFTSGSTGVPKGVTISHRGALNTIMAVNAKYTLTQKDSILALSDLSFDLSVYDIFGLLAVGGTIVFPSQDQIKEVAHWLELIYKHSITIWNSVPQLAALLLDGSYYGKDYLQSLRLFLLSGDWIPLDLPDNIKKSSGAVTVSLGGATEGSIWSIWYEIRQINSNMLSIPYGISMPNQKMYVLNHNLEPCPVGVIGEIYIGGEGIALSYWNDIDKTTASFFTHPDFSRLYKTGDLGRWMRDGHIEFIGRNDNQVKINGYRVELGEIAAKLNKLPGVSKAIVTIQRGEKQNYIVAYLLPQDGSSLYDLNEYDESFDKEVFKLSKLGIRTDLNITYKLEFNLDQRKFILQKSYREYITDIMIDTNFINGAVICAETEVNNCLNMLANKTKVTKNITLEDMSILLMEVSCIELIYKDVPKYLYPSVGGSYAVRCYLNISNMSGKGGVANGYYYYNPLQTSLSKASTWDSIGSNDNATRMDFVVYWPAIEPLYGQESRRFAYIEVGHMLALLQRQAQVLGIASKVEICEQELDQNNCLLARLILLENIPTLQTNITDSTAIISSNINVETFIKSKDHTYHSVTQHVSLDELSIFVAADPYNGKVLKNGSVLVTLNGDSSPENLVYAGMYCQTLSEKIYQNNYGSCMLGYKFYSGALYAMVIGCISEEMKTQAANKVQNVTLREYIANYISSQLPEYMLPYDYVVLQNIPLTANGKLALNQLPKLKIQTTDNINQPPENAVELKVCQLYAEVLGMDVNNVQRQDDFFRLGGNSLLAMKLLSKLNQELKIPLKIADIFMAKSVSAIATRINDLSNKT